MIGERTCQHLHQLIALNKNTTHASEKIETSIRKKEEK